MSDNVNSTYNKDLESKLISSNSRPGLDRSKVRLNKISIDSSNCQLELDSQVHSLLSMPSTVRQSGAKINLN